MKKVFYTILAFFFLITSVYAADYYVSFSTGSDSNAGTSSGSPWKYAPWMPGATSTADGTALQPDDTVYLKRGDTWTAQPLIAEESGTTGHRITFDAYGTGADPIINMNNNSSYWYGGLFVQNKSHIAFKNIEFYFPNKDGGTLYADSSGTIDDIVFDGCTFDQHYGYGNQDGFMSLVAVNTTNGGGMSNLVFQNSTFENSGHNCLRIWNRQTTSTITNVTIDNNTIYNCDHHGIDMYSDSTSVQAVTNATITNNDISECGGGMYLPNLEDSTIAGNIIYNDNTTQQSDTYGMKLDGWNRPSYQQDNLTIVGNVVYNLTSADGGSGAYWFWYLTNSKFYNNTAYGNYIYCAIDNSSGMSTANNLGYNNTNDGNCSDLGSNPLFTNPSGGDFTLQSGSPARGAGSDLGNGLDYCKDPTTGTLVDPDNYDGGNWPLGAYVYDSGTSPPPGRSLLMVDRIGLHSQ